MNNSDNESLKKWIENLKRESWQLELMVTAFTLFVLFTSKDYVNEYKNWIQFNSYGTFRIVGLLIIQAIFLAIDIFSLHLLLHLVIRGIWIGILGLSSVVGEDKLEITRFNPKFNNWLNVRLSSLDIYVLKLDKVASVIFGLAYLVFLSFVSAILFLMVGVVIGNTIGFALNHVFNHILKTFLEYILLIIIILYLLGGILYFIDFLTLGFLLKKSKRIGNWYFPIYRFYSFISLSFLYRPLYYTFIEKFNKKYVILFFLFYLFVFFLKPEFNYTIFFPQQSDNKHFQMNNAYDNLRNDDDWISKASIQSDIINDDFIRLFILYNVNDNEHLKQLCPDFVPDINEGFQNPFHIEKSNTNSIMIGSSGNIESSDENKLKMITCLKNYYKVSINDSVYNNLDFELYIHPRHEQKGIMSYIPLYSKNINSGKNEIIIFNTNESNVNDTIIRIPFWKK